MTMLTTAQIEADPEVPIIEIVRDFRATPEQLFRAHTEPELFRQWIGPADLETEITDWDARDGGRWRYVARRGEEAYSFRGCFHTVSPDRLVQTFSWEQQPDGVALETLTIEGLEDGWTRLRVQSLCGSFNERDAWLNSGMEGGVNQGYAKLDALLEAGAL